MTQNQAAARTFIPASVVLQELHDAAPADQFTLGWVMGRLLLSISLLAAVVVLALDLGLAWEVLHGVKPIRLLPRQDFAY